MIIANPIYDTVFKRLMENNRVAKFFISTLIEEDIVKLTLKPQELTYNDSPAGIAVFRYDFSAKIKTKEGKYKNVLIEIQKSGDTDDISRFRNYLAEQYKREDEITDEEGNKDTAALPIVTIYILGFKLKNIESPAIKINREYIDLINKKTIKATSEFIERLTHNSYIVQIPHIKPKVRTRLEKLLSIFEQTNFISQDAEIKEYGYKLDLEEIKLMIKILEEAGANPQVREEILKEKAAIKFYEDSFKMRTKKLIKEMKEKNREIEEKDKEIEELKRRLKEK